MDWTHVIIVFLGAPFLYFGVGLPWAVVLSRPAWAPLWGVAVLGFTAELAYVGGAPVAAVVTGVTLIHLALGAGLLWGRAQLRPDARHGLAAFGQMYLIALIPFVAAPFSTPGLWGGDWYVALESALHVWHRLPFTPELLARPPLFGAAAIPLLLVGPTVPAFQVFCAVASGCALQVFRTALKPPAPVALVWVLAASLFFLQVTLNAWPKFLSAAFLLAAWQLLDAAPVRRVALAGLFLGLAVATHQSAILFAPLLLVRWLAGSSADANRLGSLVALALAGALVVLPWEWHTVLAYGWAAKLHANPAVAQRIDAVPGWLNAGLVGAGTLAGWGPFYVVHHWLNSPDRLTVARLAHEAYWLVTSTFNSLAASLLGLVLPWWVALGWREFPRRLHGLWARLGWPVRGALALAFAGQMVLNPYYSTDGSLHTGWVPAGVALMLWFTAGLATAPGAELRAVLQWTAWLGTIPWIVFNVALTAALVLSAKFRSLFFDGDLQLLQKNGWSTLALGGFPWVQGLAAAGGWLAFKFSGRPVA